MESNNLFPSLMATRYEDMKTIFLFGLDVQIHRLYPNYLAHMVKKMLLSFSVDL